MIPLGNRCTIIRQTSTNVDGVLSVTWTEVAANVPCRIDLTFVRVGRDLLYKPDSGRAPDRNAVGFFRVNTDLKVADRVVITDDSGLSGTWEVFIKPEQATTISKAHHLEVELREVSQSIVIS